MYKTKILVSFPAKNTNNGLIASFLTQRIIDMFHQNNYLLRLIIHCFLLTKNYQVFGLNMVWLCGQLAGKPVRNCLYKFVSYTHYPQQKKLVTNSQSYTQFYTRGFTRFCTHICMQFSSVIGRFYLLSTRPTITTTYNKQVKGAA